MGLDKIFQKAEKPVEEKKLQLVSSEESLEDKKLVDLIERFDKTKDFNVSWYNLSDYLYETEEFLENYKLTPSLISKFDKAIKHKKFCGRLKFYLGAFFSALIQVSYDQGNNGFIFDKINAFCFGLHLQGKENDKISIQANRVNCHLALSKATNCFLKVKRLNGTSGFYYTTDSKLVAATVNGNSTFLYAKNCVAEIRCYEAKDFGVGMRDCKIYSPSEDVLKKIRGQVTPYYENSFFIQ
ncbi:hypothetical protein HY643_01865 [Candidatus Woesearchaeota archaeon]|nr:hypothetical protein [Candidatus Woesearchaeota archaeon]